MRDGPVRRPLKRALAFAYEAWQRARRRQSPPPWVLAGACRACAACCEAPAIGVGLMYFVPLARDAWLWWQRVVNGFVVVDRDREARAFVFRCTHFDQVTRRCDSYESRPGLCRDYPRNVMELPQPELFSSCGHRARAPNADGLLATLTAQGIDGEQLVQIRRKLRLD